MKKFIVILIAILQITWILKADNVNYSIKNTVVCYPSFSAIIKIVYISVRTSIKNLVNLLYIFSNLPRKQKTQQTQPRKNYTVILFFNLEDKKKRFNEDSPKVYYYDTIFDRFLGLFINCPSNFVVSLSYTFNNTTTLYYFSKPRSSI